MGLVALLAGGDFPLLQSGEGGGGTAGQQLLAQLVAAGDQGGQVQAMAPFEGLELGHALLQAGQAFGIAVEGGAVAIELAGQILKGFEASDAGLAQAINAGIEAGHGLQFVVAGGEVVEHRRRRLGPLHQPAQQLGHPLLEAHAVGEAVLVGLQPLAFERIIQGRRLQIFQPLLLLQSLPLKGRLLGRRPLQGRRCRLPSRKSLAGRFQ